MKVTLSLWPPVVALAILACGAPVRRDITPVRGSRVAGPVIDTLVLSAHARFLSSDHLLGRRAGSSGAWVAAEYLAAACRTLGLTPVGGADYFQPVPLLQLAITSARLEFTRNGGARVFHAPRDFVMDLGLSVTSFAGPVVYAPGSLDLASLPPVAGSVVVTDAVLNRDLLDSLTAAGAAGLLLAVRDSQHYDLYVRSRGHTRLLLDQPETPSSLLRALPTATLGPAASAAVLANAEGAESGPTGSRVRVDVDLERSAVPDRNVACLLRGTHSSARDTAVVLVAHYDHLGVGLPDQHGDSIYNGFSDNAAGVAMLLAIAQAFRDLRYAPLHSVVLLFMAAEEQGLLGSDYYAAHPRWPHDRTLGVINLDAGAPPARPASWRLAGIPGSPIALLATDVAHAQGWSATVSRATPNSDHYPFLRAGVPAVFIIPGPGPYQGMSVDSSRALRARWDHYHQPADAWAPDFPLAGLGRYAEYAFLVARALDRGVDQPR
ncbi:MAG TPA: M28 family peptidase [Gemmatimonadales bacterium]|nr:M28 family peptidase [Gemmatimonadales bacterium]